MAVKIKQKTGDDKALCSVRAHFLSLAAVPVPGAAHGGDCALTAPDLGCPEIPALPRLHPPLPQLLRCPHCLPGGSEAH